MIAERCGGTETVEASSINGKITGKGATAWHCGPRRPPFDETLKRRRDIAEVHVDPKARRYRRQPIETATNDASNLVAVRIPWVPPARFESRCGVRTTP